MPWIEDPQRETFGPFNFNELGVDEAFLNVSSQLFSKYFIYTVPTNCDKCPFKIWKEFNGTEVITKISTKFPIQFKFRVSGHPIQVHHDFDDPDTLCDTGPLSFGQYGVYDLGLSRNDSSSCFQLQEIWPPVNIYYPILIAILLYIFLGIFYNYNYASLCDNEHLRTRGKKDVNTGGRFQFIDTFRGLCIVLMIFVNEGGGGYYFLRHAAWDGLYIADLPFPWFLFIMGMCIPLSVGSKLKVNKLKMVKIVWRRALKLMALGLLLSFRSWDSANWQNFRLPGVLQRIGMCYFACATLFISLSSRHVYSSQLFWRDLKIWRGRLVILLCLTVHWLLTFHLPVPGCPTGYLGPGGLHNNNAWPSSCIGGATGHIDRLLLTRNHMARYNSAASVYHEYRETECHLFDPEGLFGILTSLFQTWLGLETGLSLTSFVSKGNLAKSWLLWSFVLGMGGILLAGGMENEGPIPINKKLWSLSFVLVTTSFGLILLTLVYFAQVKGYWDGRPFSAIGKNSILLFVGQAMGQEMPWHWQWRSMSSHSLLLLKSLWRTTLWVVLALWLHSKRIYWSL